MRTPSLTSVGSSAAPFSVTVCTVCGDRVDERRGAAVGRESHGRRGAERLGARRHVERDVVVSHREERGALLGFEAGEVLSGHVLLLSWALVAPLHD